MFSLPVIEPSANGYVIYKGKSKINGKPIVVIATGFMRKSKNEKTGEMVQVYILRDNITPTQSYFDGRDEAVCGDCIHRRKNGLGSCYVNVHKGVTQVFKSYERKNYPIVSMDKLTQLGMGKKIRLGAYGDPAAVPIIIWHKLLKAAAGWTGYTHQWRKRKFQGLKKYCMASCDLPQDRELAIRKDWRTFRIRTDTNEPLMSNEFECPASHEQAFRLNCASCLACDGGRSTKASVAIVVHGMDWKTRRFKQWRVSFANGLTQ